MSAKGFSEQQERSLTKVGRFADLKHWPKLKRALRLLHLMRVVCALLVARSALIATESLAVCKQRLKGDWFLRRCDDCFASDRRRFGGVRVALYLRGRRHASGTLRATLERMAINQFERPAPPTSARFNSRLACVQTGADRRARQERGERKSERERERMRRNSASGVTRALPLRVHPRFVRACEFTCRKQELRAQRCGSCNLQLFALVRTTLAY